MKLVEYIENHNSDNNLVDDDNASMVSSSIYTSPEKSFVVKRRNDGYERNDEKSMVSTSFSLKSFAVYDRKLFPRNCSPNSKDDISLQLTEFVENEDYSIQDIERQLDDISLGMSHASLWHPSIEHRRHDVDMLHIQERQLPEGAMNSCMYDASTTDHGDDVTQCQSTKWKVTKRTFYTSFSCVLGTVIIIILLAVLVPSRDDNNGASMRQSSYVAVSDESNAASTEPSFNTLSFDAPTQSPTTAQKYLHQPTMVPTYVLDDDECEDDNEAIVRIGNDHRDCAWLAQHEASQAIFCQSVYPHVYNVCKATCHNCNDQLSANGEGGNTPTVAPTVLETVGPPPQPVTNTIQQPPPTSSNIIGQGAVVCLDDIDATIDIGQHEGVNCTWLASHPASQIIFCRSDYFPLVYNTCKATCKNCD